MSIVFVVLRYNASLFFNHFFRIHLPERLESYLFLQGLKK